MVVWWITVAIPIYAMAAVPLVLFPVLGILSPKRHGGLLRRPERVFRLHHDHHLHDVQYPGITGYLPWPPFWAVIPGK